MHISRRLSAAAILILALGAASANAQGPDYSDLSIEEALQVCVAFEDAVERLACFEALAKSAKGSTEVLQAPQAAAPSQAPKADPSTDEPQAPAAAEGRAAPAAKAEAAVESASPRATPRFKFVRDDEPEQKRHKRERHEATVYRAWRNAMGELRIAFTNGEIWVQAGRGVLHTPQPGEIIVFKPGLAGGWTLSMQGGRYGVRARQLKRKD